MTPEAGAFDPSDGGTAERDQRPAEQGPAERLLRPVLVIVLIAVITVDAVHLLLTHPWAVDLVIPLRAAERWVHGGQPYLPESFRVGPGYDLPFLYPPVFLPFLAVLAALPFWLVTAAWYLLQVAVAVWTGRRLAIPWPWLALVLLWPPYFEALLGGNSQVLLFGAFVALLYGRATAGARWQPSERDPRSADRPAVVDGLLGAVSGAVKVSQVQPWVYLLRRRPPAAIVGAAIVGLVLLASVALTGLTAWTDWLAQLGRASDPAWPLVGSSYLQYLPAPLAWGIVLASVLLALVVPPRHAAAWLGILMIAGNPSLRIFSMLYLLPGLLRVRREVALLAALLVASYFPPALWLATVLVGAALVLGRSRPERWLAGTSGGRPG